MMGARGSGWVQSLWAVALLCTALLGGCASVPPVASTVPLRQARAGIVAFAVEGRLAARQGDRHYACNISWQHAVDTDEMLFSTPLGQGLAELTRTPGAARLTMADHRQFLAADWEELAIRVFGMPLPLSALPHWLLAEIPATAREVVRDELGRPRQLRSDGWQISYLDYEREDSNALPTLLELRREDIEVRVKVDEWTLAQ